MASRHQPRRVNPVALDEILSRTLRPALRKPLVVFGRADGVRVPMDDDGIFHYVGIISAPRRPGKAARA